MGQKSQYPQKFSKSDIRSFGKIGSKTKLTSEAEFNKQLKNKAEQLRQSKASSGVLPNIMDRINAGDIFDKIEKNCPVYVSDNKVNELGEAQITDKLAIVGADVKSLYPSLKNVEIARLARHAILESKISFENIDYKRALRYLYIVGGKDLLAKRNLSRISPKWLGDRGDLITVGGSKSKGDASWKDTNKDIFDSEKLRIMATVIEIAVTVVMSTHVYNFCGRIFL